VALRKGATDGDRFRLKPAAPEARSGPRTQRFVSHVLKAVSKAGANTPGASGARPASTFGRGRVAAGMAGRHVGAAGRRVVIKSRFVVLRKASATTTATHLRYIERDGVARDGQKGQAYGADTDAADLRAFEERGRHDRHQFRFIVSVEDALELEDVKGFTRQLMERMSVDLETPLDWVAVDHWDTDNPHTHIVLNGRTGRSANARDDLIISPDYMAHGMRLRAVEIATEWLGPRTEQEIRQGLLREVTQQRLTSLDRTLLRLAVLDVVDMAESQGTPDATKRPLLRSRLQRLEALALAERIDAHRWRLAPQTERSLTALGEQSDILRTMHRTLHGARRELRIEQGASAEVVGRIAGKGLADELQDRGYLVIDGIDGRAHYLKLPAGTDLAQFPVGGIVKAKPRGKEMPVDRDILAASHDGVYRTSVHLAQLKRTGETDPQSIIEVHVRRLEALRRAGLVDRLADGAWKVPADLVQQTQHRDRSRTVGMSLELRSHLPIEQQVRAIGATWLDRELLSEGRGLALQGFGIQVYEALRERVDFLKEQGLAELRGQRVVLARNLLATLRDRELATAGKNLQGQTGRTYRPFQNGHPASGIYRQSIQLASGRFAMLDDGSGFSLVPWRPVIEQRLGQRVSIVMRGASISWNLRRQHGPSL
jgi:type IV secretory pathway VirD2 relaxase